MPESIPKPARFQMIGSRAALNAGPSIESLDQQIQAVEEALERIPDFAFDLSKTLVETVCKTILSDLGQQLGANWEGPTLVREVTNRLTLLPPSHPNAAAARQSITHVFRGLHETMQGLCELRNKFGLASHGRDAFAARLTMRQATLAAQAADTITAFLYNMHRDASNRTPGDRLYYEDHREFNESFDQDNAVVLIGDIKLLPSRVLYHADREAYKDALNAFISERDAINHTEIPGEGATGEPA